MEVHVKGTKHSINVHRIVYPDDAVPSALCNPNQFRIYRDADLCDLFSHLATNGILIQWRVFVVARDALKLLLELIRLDIWRHHLPQKIDDRSYYKNAKKRFEPRHVNQRARADLLRNLPQFFSNFGHASIDGLTCRALYELHFPFGNLLANIDPIRDSH